MGKYKKALGAQGEHQAVEYLKSKNFLILETNYRLKNGELDIVAVDKRKKAPILVCIEVKTRSTNLFGTPFESITKKKIYFLKRTLEVYKLQNKNTPDLMRIDAISVGFDQDKPVLEHVEDISSSFT